MNDNMQMFHVSGNRIIEDDIVGESVHAVAIQFRERYGFLPDTVGIFQLVGECERCEIPIFELDCYYWCATDSTFICNQCIKETTIALN